MGAAAVSKVVAGRGVEKPGVETVIDRDMAREGIINPLLGLDRDDRPPTGHLPSPTDGVGSDIRAAIDRHDAVAGEPSPQIEDHRANGNFTQLVGRFIQDFEADAEPTVLAHLIVEAVNDHRSMIGGRQDEGYLAERMI
jgi:hypothetical protein